MSDLRKTFIRDGRIVDGTGNPWFYGDVVLQGDRVLEVAARGKIKHVADAEVVDAAGCVVSPGFIDVMSHSLLPLMIDGRSLSKITQGVTTEIMGEAWTPAPVGGFITDGFGDRITEQKYPGWREKGKTWTRFGAWLKAFEAHGVSVNIGSFVGGSTIREYGRNWDARPSSAEQIATMQRVMAECMEDGAKGIATALIYPPGSYADTDELVKIAEVVGRYGGVYITHVRSEAADLLKGIGEAIEIGRRAKCAVQIYHLKAAGEKNWHRMDGAIELIEKARQEGLDVTADMYPYAASGTGLAALVPQWASEGNKLYERLTDPAMRRRIRAEMEANKGPMESGVQYVMPVGFKKEEHRPYVGKRLSEIAQMRGQDWAEAAMDLLAAEKQEIFTIYFAMNEENVKKQMKLPWLNFGTDAGGLDPAQQPLPKHPRSYGSYPRILGKYVRDEKVLTLEDAVRKMTSAVANRVGIVGRGVLRAGSFADVVVFDPEKIQDHSTFEQPHQLSVGVREVWVNGAQTLKAGKHTGMKRGRVV